MNGNNIKLKAISLNVRGIRTLEKRKGIFNWLIKQNADICFLQETYSTKEIENQWKAQWHGDFFFAHGSAHSRGVAILIRHTLDFKVISVKSDEEGRFILLEANIQDCSFLLVNIYTPNITTQQSEFFHKISNMINSEEHFKQCKILLGGDFNLTRDLSLDCLGGNPTYKNSVKILDDILNENDLIDIWRIQNPDSKRFTWRQKRPFIQRRLDYWFISDILEDDVAKADIITAIKTDHSAVILEIDSLIDQPHGPSFWKLNNSLLEDTDYILLMREMFPEWKTEINFCNDPRIVWDWIKFKVRQETITYSKQKARQRRDKLTIIENKLKICEEEVAASPIPVNVENLEKVKAEYEREYDYIVAGSIIRSRTTWYEKGERNTKFFLNLENNKKKKSSIRKLIQSNGKESTNPNTISKEIEFFFADLYDEKAEFTFDQTTCPLLNSANTPKLSDELRDTCEGELTYAECFNILSTFKNNKTPGNDGLSVEFYKVFWAEIGRNLVDSLNYSYHHGELSTTQKQAVITLLEKKNRDRRLIKNWRPISLVNVDAKIGSKAIAKRLEKVLPQIIHFDQYAYVKGRTIFDAVRTIDDVIEFTKRKGHKGILTTIDFEKAFDSINRSFLFSTLEVFGFDASFITWIKTFYNDISSCVINNGFITPFFQVKRGVRQGDPLSPYLFIIALETLAIYIRNNNQIRGIKINETETIKLVNFADDITTFVSDKSSFFNLMDSVKHFSRYSGLNMNREKIEILPLGNMELHHNDMGLKK